MQRSATRSNSPVSSSQGGEGGGFAAEADSETLPGLDEADLDFDPAELREFLAGDLLDVQADPIFEQRLRRKLWRMVRSQYGHGGADGDD